MDSFRVSNVQVHNEGVPSTLCVIRGKLHILEEDGLQECRKLSTDSSSIYYPSPVTLTMRGARFKLHASLWNANLDVEELPTKAITKDELNELVFMLS